MTSLYNPVLGIDPFTEDFTFGGGSYETDYPVTNAQNLVYAKVARTTDLQAASLVLTGTSTTMRGVRLFGIAAHNMSRLATYRLRLYSDVAMATELYDSGIQRVWPSVRSYTGRSWYSPGFWTGQYTQAEMSGQIPFLPIYLSQAYNIRAFRFDFSDANNPDGYVEIGLLEVAGGWQPSGGVQYGAQFGLRNYDQTTELDGGLVRHFEFAPSYVFQGEIPALDETELFNNAFELFRRNKAVRPFIWIPYPDKPLTYLQTAKMVRLANPGLFGHAFYNYGSVPLNLEEYKG